MVQYLLPAGLRGIVVASEMYRNENNDQFPPDGPGANGMPEMPHYVNGQRYFSNWHNSNPTNGASIATIWVDRDGVAVPVAAGAVYSPELLTIPMPVDDQVKLGWVPMAAPN